MSSVIANYHKQSHNLPCQSTDISQTPNFWPLLDELPSETVHACTEEPVWFALVRWLSAFQICQCLIASVPWVWAHGPMCIHNGVSACDSFLEGLCSASLFVIAAFVCSWRPLLFYLHYWGRLGELQLLRYAATAAGEVRLTTRNIEVVLASILLERLLIAWRLALVNRDSCLAVERANCLLRQIWGKYWIGALLNARAALPELGCLLLGLHRQVVEAGGRVRLVVRSAVILVRRNRSSRGSRVLVVLYFIYQLV